MNHSIIGKSFITLAAVWSFAAICHGQNRYLVTDLGNLTAASTVAHKLNASGHAAGTSGQRDGGGAHAAFWNDNAKTLQPVSVLDHADYSEAVSINNRNEMVGLSNTEKNMRAVLWTSEGAVRDLGTLPGDNSSRAFGINDHSRVVGMSSGAHGERAFVWSRQNGMEALAVPSNAKSSEAHGINNKDQIVGDFQAADETRAFLYTPNLGVEDLGVLPGFQNSKGTGINDWGEVVGSSSGPSGTRSFIWTKKEGMRAIDSIVPTEFSEALDINNRGDVVGTYEGSLGNRAYRWNKEDGFVDLNRLLPAGSGAVLTLAVSINDQGQILAIGVSHGDISADRPVNQDEEDDLHSVDIHSFLLTPSSDVSHRRIESRRIP